MSQSVISIENVSKVFPSKVGAPPVYALKNINLQVKKGEIFGVIGMSGAGKSTLIRCLTALEKPTEGKIFLEGKELTALGARELIAARKRIGMIFQHFPLLSSRSALDNVAYPLEISGVDKRTRREKAAELLELVGLKEREAHYPSQLSGGEKQRVAIARALITKPAVFLCDEATSALDPGTMHKLLELLSDLSEKLGVTLVMITHQMEVVKQICTHVAVLEHGEIVEQGAVHDLFTHPHHPTTRRFLKSMVHDVPLSYFPTHEKSELLRLSFTRGSADKPLISEIIRTFQVEVNILLGGIDVLKTDTVGNLVIELSGEREERLKARLFLEEHRVVCEEVSHDSV
ncbi:MAG: Methionine import ATP-binding protein MetN [Chlamydiae bacterium]|nr:Methionine import ATP-binding protein MetN [Chlamydiota bacterium]